MTEIDIHLRYSPGSLEFGSFTMTRKGEPEYESDGIEVRIERPATDTEPKAVVRAWLPMSEWRKIARSIQR